MKIFIEIPTWLGDAVMCTPAIENIIKSFPDAKLIIFGSFVSTQLFSKHPNLKELIIDDSKKEGFRYKNLYSLAKSVEEVDFAISFRKNITTKFLLFFINAKEKYIYKRYTKKQVHQVIRYNDFINRVFNIKTSPSSLKIYGYLKTKQNKPLLGINPGATYGSAKRWYPDKFAEVIINLSKEFDTIIFGGPSEIKMAEDIERILQEKKIMNYKNLAGKTSVQELLEYINNLDLFITNDSGPMHVSAAFSIPSICIFGPTKDIETSQWNNNKSVLLKKDFKCMPCMKRECPLEGEEYHQCMKAIGVIDVLKSVESFGTLR